jgi:hypothetical protein
MSLSAQPTVSNTTYTVPTKHDTALVIFLNHLTTSNDDDDNNNNNNNEIELYTEAKRNDDSDGMIDAAKAASAIVAAQTSVQVWGNTDDCYHCLNVMLVPRLNSTVPQQYAVDTRFPFRFEIRRNGTSLSNFTFHYTEGGVYQIAITDDNSTPVQQQLTVLVEGHNAYLPILYAAIGYGSIALLYIAYAKLFKQSVHRVVGDVLRQVRDDHTMSVNVVGSVANSDIAAMAIKPKKSGRVVALDSFRGMCLVVMIFVNYGGGRQWGKAYGESGSSSFIRHASPHLVHFSSSQKKKTRRILLLQS